MRPPFHGALTDDPCNILCRTQIVFHRTVFCILLLLSVSEISVFSSVFCSPDTLGSVVIQFLNGARNVMKVISNYVYF